MISFILTAQIIFTLNAGIVPICNDLGFPVLDGCYDSQGKVYVSEVTSRPKDFILYHEIGHSLFNTDPDYEDVEKMAENFALYIYESKYVNSFIKSRYDFSHKCNQECVDEIIDIKVPQMTYPIKPFNVRI